MTRDEKLKVVNDFCGSDCQNCGIDPICDKIHGDFEHHLEELEEAYEIISKSNNEDNDVVNHPNHYTNGGMECFDEMLLVFGTETVAHFCLCNAWKYRYRALYKNGEEDIKKSHWYMNKYKELTACECIQQRENI